MNNLTPHLALAAVMALGLAACEQPSDSLAGLPDYGYSGRYATGGGETSHTNDPNAAEPGAVFAAPEISAKKVQNALVGSPDTAARLHGCGKIGYDQLGVLLKSRGVALTATAGSGTGTGGGRGTGGGAATTTATTAGGLYTGGGAALGVANYTGRVPESSFYSTSAQAKQMDIFAMAASEIAAAAWTSTACPSIKILDASGAFTKDGISCLMGKPATDQHVAIANSAATTASDPAKGKQIAIAAILAASHSCE